MGIEFDKVQGAMVVYQSKFIKELLHDYSVDDSPSVSTPLSSQLKLLPIMDDLFPEPTIYRQLIGKLNFLLHTRPDLAFSVQYLS